MPSRHPARDAGSSSERSNTSSVWLDAGSGSGMTFFGRSANRHAVIPAQAGIQSCVEEVAITGLDSRLRGNVFGAEE